MIDDEGHILPDPAEIYLPKDFSGLGMHPDIIHRMNQKSTTAMKSYLQERVDKFLEDAEKLLGDNCTSTENYYHTQRSTDNVPVFAVSLVILILIILNIFTVLVVIRLLLKTVFIKREKEFGIKKAVGFTSRQLRIQLALSLIPVSIIGSVLGGIAACLTTNKLFDLIFSSYGIKNSDLLINPGVIPVTILLVTLLVFVISFIMSGRMKKVSAYQLISE
jgi:ABC-type antimicrobial peptide transport system permease subunit